jgi:hypothetical protein
MDDPHDLRRLARRASRRAERSLDTARDLAEALKATKDVRLLDKLTREFCRAGDELRKSIELAARLEREARRAERSRAASGVPQPPPRPSGTTVH